jgi:hypothetical protein
MGTLYICYERFELWVSDGAVTEWSSYLRVLYQTSSQVKWTGISLDHQTEFRLLRIQAETYSYNRQLIHVFISSPNSFWLPRVSVCSLHRGPSP